MKRKVALKRLSASDLTLFEHHFRNTRGTKQKAFNLDAAVFIKSLYPALPNKLNLTNDRIPLDLSLYGPGTAGLHNLQRKILKQDKNWRLNGELIHNPEDQDSRYNSLEKGDFAIIEFIGDTEPRSARAYLVARSLQVDTNLHAALVGRYGQHFAAHRGMHTVDPGEIAEVVANINLPEEHPIFDLIEEPALEDAAQGGLEGVRELRKRRRSRGVGHEELEQARQRAAQIGRLGEEILNGWLQQEALAGSIPGFRWEAKTNAVAPYDFVIVNGAHDERKIDAKSTSGDFGNVVHISAAELHEMATGELPYDLYRLYSVNESSALLRIAKDVSSFASDVLNVLHELPDAVEADGISVRPEALNFGDVIEINVADETDTGEAGSITDLFDTPNGEV